MHKKTSELFNELRTHQVVSSLQGGDGIVTNIAPAEDCRSGDLVFVDRIDFVEQVLARKPTAVITTQALALHFADCGFDVLVCSQIRLVQAWLLQSYMDRDCHNSEWGCKHPSAIIHESAAIPATTVIGPGVVIGKDVQLGEKCVVMANSVIEYGSVIGADVVIHPNVVVGYNCQIGARCILKSGCVIGAEGFGFAQDEARKSHRIPQLGLVVIEADVVIGANTTVDRATYRETRIGTGCKIDALCHIGHNVTIGEHSIFVAQTAIAGSTKIGKRVMTSGQVGFLDHLTIADDTTFVHRAGVSDDVTEKGMYAAMPLQPFRQYMKNMASLQKLAQMRQRLAALERKVAGLLPKSKTEN